ncbi:MAG: 5'/3'-nucleotidase SurE [bacterium]
MKKVIFLTNDDGIHAVGLSALEEQLKNRDIPFFTAAPLYEMSGSGHSITLDKPLKAKKFKENRYGVTGTPADSVFLGLRLLLKEKPAFAVSGINRGANLGNDVSYSGTVSAAVETFYHGVTSFAVSLHISERENFNDSLFQDSAHILFDIVIPEIEQKLGEELYLKPHLFNINIPDTVFKKGICEIEWTFPGKRLYSEDIIKRVDPRGAEYYWIGGSLHMFEDIKGSDCNAIKNGFISVSPMKISFSDSLLLDKLNNN